MKAEIILISPSQRSRLIQELRALLASLRMLIFNTLIDFKRENLEEKKNICTNFLDVMFFILCFNRKVLGISGLFHVRTRKMKIKSNERVKYFCTFIKL